MKKTIALFQACNMPQTTQYYAEVCQQPTLVSTGSSNIDGSLRAACIEINQHMAKEHMAGNPATLRMQQFMTAIGDPSGTLTFGGYQLQGDKVVRITVRKYFELLATTAHKLSPDARECLEKICSSYLRVQQAIRAGDCREIDS